MAINIFDVWLLYFLRFNNQIRIKLNTSKHLTLPVAGFKARTLALILR